jgi:hypothetical protein
VFIRRAGVLAGSEDVIAAGKPVELNRLREA